MKKEILILQSEQSDDDYEEEEIIVFADFQTKLTSDALMSDPNLNVKIIGIDTEAPLIQINSKVFQGN